MDCPEKVAEWVIQWCAPDAMDIAAIGQAIASQLAKLGLIIHPGELYGLSDGDWERVEGVSEEQLAEIKQQLDRSKPANSSALIYGFRIKGVDQRLAKRLGEEFTSISKLRETKPDHLTTIEGIGEESASAIRRWFRDSFNKKMLKMLEREGFNLD
jgi:DNA ligase (NAD+)